MVPRRWIIPNNDVGAFRRRCDMQVLNGKLVIQETQLSLTGRAQHHIKVLLVEYDTRNKFSNLIPDRCNASHIIDAVFLDTDNETVYSS